MDNALISALAEALKPCIKDAIKENLRDLLGNPGFLREEKPDLVNIDVAAEITGLAKQTLYSRTSQGTIPYHKRGKRLYFSRKELEVWIKNDN